jgi:hypothetical protein
MFTAVMFIAGELIPFAWVQSAELSVDVRVSPRVEKGRISPYVFGAEIDHKTERTTTNSARDSPVPVAVARGVVHATLAVFDFDQRHIFRVYCI